VPQFRASLASALYQQGEVFGGLKRTEQARAVLERSAGLMEELVADFPVIPGYSNTAASVLASLAGLDLENGRTEEARRFVGRATRHLDVVSAADPDSAGTVYLVQQTSALLGRLRALDGDARGADDAARRIEAVSRSGRSHYNASGYLNGIRKAIL